MQLDYDTSRLVTAAIQAYFAEERRWGIAVLASSAIVVALASTLFFIVRDAFSKGFLISALCAFGLLLIVCGSLLLRDPGIASGLAAAVQTEHATQAVAQEHARLGKILHNFTYNRWIILVLGAVAIALSGFLAAEAGNGVAVGLFLVVILLVFDRYSELRVERYREQLAAALNQ